MILFQLVRLSPLLFYLFEFKFATATSACTLFYFQFPTTSRNTRAALKKMDFTSANAQLEKLEKAFSLVLSLAFLNTKILTYVYCTFQYQCM